MSNNSVNNAIDNVLDTDSDLTLEERLDELGQEIIANSFFLLDKARKTKEKVSDEDQVAQEESIKQFNIINGIYSKMKKNGRINGSTNSNFDSQLIEKIKKMKGSMGDIVQSTSTNTTD